MRELTKITIKELPHLLPWTQSDYMFAFNRPQFIGYYDEIFKTEEKHATYYDAWERERVVQIISYNKYKLTLPGKEYNGIHLLKYADYIVIENGEEIYEAKVLEVTERGEFINKLYDITFYDIRKQNYIDLQQPVSNYLRQDVLTDRYSETGLLAMNVYQKSTQALPIYQFFSLLAPKIRRNEPRLKEEEVAGINVTTYSTNEVEWICTFFLNSVLLGQLYRFARFSANNDSSNYIDLVYNGVTQKIIEHIKPEVTQITGAVDLYRVEIKGKVTNIEQLFFD